MTVAPARLRQSAARWWPWFRLLAVLAILAALVSLLGTKAFVTGLHVLTPGAMLAALGVGLATTVCNAMRWRLVAQRVGLRLPLGDAITETYRATFLNAVLPGGVLGDVDRAFRHGRSSGDVARGARAVAIERTAGQLVVFAAALVVIPAEPALVMEIGRRLSRTPLLGFGLVVAVVVLVAVLLARRAPADRTTEPARWRRVLGDTAADVRAGALARTVWPLLLLLSAATLAGYLLLFLIAARMAGATAPALTLLPPLLLALMAMSLPISVGGWGPREGVAAFTFWMAGLGAPLGVTSSVAYGALALIASLPGGAVLLARRLARSRPHPTPASEPASAPVLVTALPAQRVRQRPVEPVPSGPLWTSEQAERSEAS
ncbi:MAG TPA: lysylphosphatidylglycerol synthase transmembrane domain-containing protein [Pseudonocardia sp.]|nr:lysylphosphatidylglycerol synthase transmembrane domain-containing protein [Pseudonocardia sp.]